MKLSQLACVRFRDALWLVDGTTAVDRELHRALVDAMDNPTVSGVYERAVW